MKLGMSNPWKVCFSWTEQNVEKVTANGSLFHGKWYQIFFRFLEPAAFLLGAAKSILWRICTENNKKKY